MKKSLFLISATSMFLLQSNAIFAADDFDVAQVKTNNKLRYERMSKSKKTTDIGKAKQREINEDKVECECEFSTDVGVKITAGSRKVLDTIGGAS